MPNQLREQEFAKELFNRLKISPTDRKSGERPDLRFRHEGSVIGLEITESTPSEKYWGRKIAEGLKEPKGDPPRPVIYSSTNLRNHGRRRSRDEVRGDMFNSDGYCDLQEELRTWCADVRAQWARKRKKLQEKTYSRFDEDWLLIWDNAGLSDNLYTLANIPEEILRTNFFSNEGDEFHHVYVLSGNYTFDFTRRKVGFIHERANEVNSWLTAVPGRMPGSIS